MRFKVLCIAPGKFRLPADKRARTILLFLAFLAVGAVCLFLFQGISPENAAFNLPRRAMKITAMVLVAICTGYSAVVFQTITENRILTPSVMGLDALYLFIQSLVVFLFGAQQLTMMDATLHFLLSAGGMMLASGILYQFIFDGENRNVYVLVLIGIVMGIFFSGIASFMQMLIDPNEFLVLQDAMFASFKIINEDLLFISAAITIFVLLFSWRDLSRFDVLGLGRDTAISLGVGYNGLVRRTLLMVAVLVSVATALVGPITFLGILLVSLAREILNTFRHRDMILGAVLIGVIALVLGQFMVERILQTTTTVGVILNFVGGTCFIVLLLRESKR
ncbi:iron chelate uptake ABC transporter family permease subunit|uniref:Iron complex transport system permease protein n=1 Tax=Dendrosporobacter quercicolus TaxID=146817 RepID=A0A1G9YBZ0_9FIRM|nr:iron chelate uptake ABC transporter family permease subunit [Dendrosporobacter quercicolus]NSL47604.1 iron chelate uptake ABC transporter family permease subunit [Dendrosporobacter quercicolus DSM 1736]SDN06602.1 iron complex transport system permease protein [Dendrosporobacter quercicolus]